MERLKKWEERKAIHSEKKKVEEYGRARESKKYTVKFGESLVKAREQKTKDEENRHQIVYMKQL